jgi:hypothetical protein
MHIHYRLGLGSTTFTTVGLQELQSGRVNVLFFRS